MKNVRVTLIVLETLNLFHKIFTTWNIRIDLYQYEEHKKCWMIPKHNFMALPLYVFHFNFVTNNHSTLLHVEVNLVYL